ncbi:MAG: aminotransferase class V-fold PLP-dependent enzyme [Pseudomonadota bacterium]
MPTSRIPGRRLLHSPGPTPIPDAVLHAMAQQPMDLADPRVDATISACEDGLKRLLHTREADVFMFAANGHGGWESVIENVAAVGETVLVCGTGHFSESWAVQSEALGRRVLRTPWREGHCIDLQALDEALRADQAHMIRAVFVVHTDTASSVTTDLAPIRPLLDRLGHPALFVADVVASLAACAFDFDALGVDVAIGASQKGLMCPPGLSFTAVNARALAHAKDIPAPRFYWDWARRKSNLSYMKFCGTPPMNLLFGLEAALGLLFAEGLPAVWKRHALVASAVHAAVEGWSEGGAMDFLAIEPATRSVSVTTIAMRSNIDIDIDALRTVARERYQVAIAGGLGPMTGRAFRIGHLGDCNVAMILGAIGGVEAALRTQGIPVGGGVQRAVEALARAT